MKNNNNNNNHYKKIDHSESARRNLRNGFFSSSDRYPFETIHMLLRSIKCRSCPSLHVRGARALVGHTERRSRNTMTSSPPTALKKRNVPAVNFLTTLNQ